MAVLVSSKSIDIPADMDSGERPTEPPDAVKQDSANPSVAVSWLDQHDPSKEYRNESVQPSVDKFRRKRSRVNVKWEDITLTTKKGKQILKEISGAAQSGELTAIMGPSGAGKSSLLNVLAGFTCEKVTGQILINGSDRDMRFFRKYTCYIMQDDHILPCLTVREIVSIAANLKISTSVSKYEKQAEVDKCLRCLGLEAQKDQKASQLSGGQRKRLCIAQELVSNPLLIILDEPTSGLDSSSCLQCIQLLKSLAKDGKTVVCSIHQPSSMIYETFDQLYMLADGECIYRGSTKRLIPFLAEQGLICPQYHNPADYVTEVAVGEHGDWNWRLKNAIDAMDDADGRTSETNLLASDSNQNLQNSTLSLLPNAYAYRKKSSVSQEKLARIYNDYATSSFNQFRILFCRSFLCILREPINTFVKLVGNISVALLLGTLFYDVGNDASRVFNNTGLMFSDVTFLIFTSNLPTLLTFPMERTIFEREHMNSWYSTKMYYLATTVAEIPFQVLFPIINGSIVYWMTGQPSDMFRFCYFLLSIVLLSLVSQSTGLLIGACVDVQNGVYINAVMSIPMLLFCGFFMPTNTITSYLKWIPYCSYVYYAFQSVMLSFYSMDRPFLYCNKTVCPFEDPEEIIKELGFEGELYVDYLALLGFFILFRIAAYLLLKYRIQRTVK